MTAIKDKKSNEPPTDSTIAVLRFWRNAAMVPATQHITEIAA
jgi:hypothetical protein